MVVEFSGGAVLKLVILAVLIIFVLVTGIALILGIPLLGISLGGAIGLSAAGLTAFQAANPIEQILQAVFDGIASVVNALFAGIVVIVTTMAAVVAQIIQLLFIAPFRFIAEGFNTAIRSLEGFGIAAPLAVVFVVVASLAILGVAGYLAVQGIKTLLPGDQ